MHFWLLSDGRRVEGIVEDECTDDTPMSFEDVGDVATSNVPDLDYPVCGSRCKVGRGWVGRADVNGGVMGTRNGSDRMDWLLNGIQRFWDFINA